LRYHSVFAKASCVGLEAEAGDQETSWMKDPMSQLRLTLPRSSSLEVAILALALAGFSVSGCGGGDTTNSNGSGSGGTTGASGGTGGSGGSTGGTGGSAGGAGGSGGATSGASGSGGSAAMGGSAGSVGSNRFTINASLSSAIATVGIVEWSIDVPIQSAVIDFGRDQAAFEYQAPVDLMKASYRTLLLGMKPSTTYYARITAQGAGGPYTSDVFTLETGFLPNGLPTLEVETLNEAALYAGGGFTVNCTGLSSGPGIGNPSSDSWAFIFDRDGDQVWAFELTDTQVSGCSRARMSVDGQSMWAGNFNNASDRSSRTAAGTPTAKRAPTTSWSLILRRARRPSSTTKCGIFPNKSMIRKAPIPIR
jgi:hypothetical protein